MNPPVPQPMGQFVANLIAGLRERLPRDAEGRPICARCKQLVPETEAVCWPCAEQAQRAENLAEARRVIVDGTRELVASLPPWPWADVRSEEWRNRVHPRLLNLAERYTTLKGSICTISPAGLGKTSAHRALLCRLIVDAKRAGDVAHPVVSARWSSAVEYAKHRRELRRGTPDLELANMQRASLLVIDELGQEDAQPHWLLEVLDERYRHRRPTLTTSGLTRAQLEQRYGTGIARRLVEPVGQFIDLHGGEGGR